MPASRSVLAIVIGMLLILHAKSKAQSKPANNTPASQIHNWVKSPGFKDTVIPIPVNEVPNRKCSFHSSRCSSIDRWADTDTRFMITVSELDTITLIGVNHLGTRIIYNGNLPLVAGRNIIYDDELTGLADHPQCFSTLFFVCFRKTGREFHCIQYNSGK